MFAVIWRFFVALFDYRTHLRRITKRPIVDVVFITNMRDQVDRLRYLGRWHPKNGHFNGPRYWINGIVGRTRALDIVTEDLSTSEGRKKAKGYFKSAVRWSKDHGAKVILLAASTKRLFGEQGAEIKKLFPDLIFTIGDNGTAFLLIQETLQTLERAGLKSGFCKIAVLGPYGLLGEVMVQALVAAGYNVIGAGSNFSALNRIAKIYGVKTCQSFFEIGAVDAVVACTHSNKIRLNADMIKIIRREGRKIIVIDVAEPANLSRAEYLKCADQVIRRDAGCAYSSHLKYVLGAISYKMFRLTKGVTFGCFAEALTLANALRMGENVKSADWFHINADNIAMIGNMFGSFGFFSTSPKCFGKPIRNFDLNIDPLTSGNAKKSVVYTKNI